MTYEKIIVPSPTGGQVEYWVDTGQMDPIQARVVAHRFREDPYMLRRDVTADFNRRIASGIRAAGRALMEGRSGAGRNLLLMMVGPSGWGKTDCNLSILFRAHVEAVRAGLFDLPASRGGSERQDAPPGGGGGSEADHLEEYRLFSPERNYHASLLSAFNSRRENPVGYAGVYDDPSLLLTDDVKNQMAMAMRQLMESFESRRAAVQSGGVSSVRATRFMDPSLVHYMGLPYHLDPEGRFALVALWGMSDAGRHPLGYYIVPPPERVIRRRVDGLDVASLDGPGWMEAQEEVKGRQRLAVTEGRSRVRPENDLLARILGETPLDVLDRVMRFKNSREEFLSKHVGGEVASVGPLERLWRSTLDETGWRTAKGTVRSRALDEEGRRAWISGLLGAKDGNTEGGGVVVAGGATS